MSRVSRSFRIVGWVLRILLSLAIGAVIGLLCWRLFVSTSVPANVKTIDANEKLCRAYREAGGDLYMFSQNQTSITRGEKNAGYFSTEDTRIIPDANQIQILFRYNNSTIRSLTEDYALEETPDRSAELFDTSVLLAVDLTPEDDLDNDGNDPESVRFVRCQAKVTASAEKHMYNYRRLVFDLDECGEDLRELLDNGTLLAIYLDVYYVGDLDYEDTPYGVLCLYDYGAETAKVSMTGKDKKAIRNAG